MLDDVLQRAGLLGIEPPIVPLAQALRERSSEFSSDFRQRLDDALDRFIAGGRDPKDSAFWRAVRSVTLHGTVGDDDAKSSGSATILATWDDDETLSLRVGCTSESKPPGTLELRRADFELEGYSHFMADATGDPDAAVSMALAGESFVGPGLANLVRQGILVFQSAVGGDYKVAFGEDINGADLALVRNDLAATFRSTFGGAVAQSRFDGWSEVERCQVHQVSHPPAGMAQATQLMYTTRPPRPRAVHGIRVGDGFLWLPGSEPIIRAPGAREVVASCDGASRTCSGTGTPGEWALPADLVKHVPNDVTVEARWDVELGGEAFVRIGETSIHLEGTGVGCEYRPAGAGRYLRESCNPAQRQHEGGDEMPLDLETEDPSAAPDLLMVDPTIRYLGRGLGEIAATRAETFPWLAVGPRSQPTQLVYVGDIEDPLLPDGGLSTNKGDRRVWSRAFTCRKAVTSARLGTGGFRLLEDEPRLEEIIATYRKRARRLMEVGPSRACPPFGVPPERGCDQLHPDPSASTLRTVEAVAALGLRRSGIPLKEFQELLHAMTGDHDYLLWEQIVRAWLESGMIDVLRRQDRSQTIVAPRRPRFVMLRRGPVVQATLVGLASHTVGQLVLGSLCKRGVQAEHLAGSSPFTPRPLRAIDCRPGDIAEVSREMGLQDPCWLRWNDLDDLPDHLAIGADHDGLNAGVAPPDPYGLNAEWDWDRMTFARDTSPDCGEEIRVERRWHPLRCSIYVVLSGDRPEAWCHMRDWTLLRASELRRVEPLRLTLDGTIESSGAAPIHLPLPVARLCVIAGTGVPGPVRGENQAAIVYRYPFGAALGRKIADVLPTGWVKVGKEES